MDSDCRDREYESLERELPAGEPLERKMPERRMPEEKLPAGEPLEGKMPERRMPEEKLPPGELLEGGSAGEKQMEAETAETGILEEIKRQSGGGRLTAGQYSALALAFIGDAVYGLVIRTLILEKGNYKVKLLHRMTSDIVKAESQAKLAAAIMDELTVKEQEIFHHGRNTKSGSSAKNASITDYRIATGLEALVGYLYLDGQTSRMISLISMGLERTGQI